MTTRSASSFRIGRVRGDRRGQVWYLCYQEQGKRCRPRVGPDREAAKLLASQANAQLESGSQACTSFEPVDFLELQRRWLEHHEQVRRSSLATDLPPLTR